jgi:hypothetical protein
VTVVLGAGNVSSIPLMDAFYKLFVEGSVVLLKNAPPEAAMPFDMYDDVILIRDLTEHSLRAGDVERSSSAMPYAVSPRKATLSSFSIWPGTRLPSQRCRPAPYAFRDRPAVRAPIA